MVRSSTKAHRPRTALKSLSGACRCTALNSAVTRLLTGVTVKSAYVVTAPKKVRAGTELVGMLKGLK